MNLKTREKAGFLFIPNLSTVDLFFVSLRGFLKIVYMV